MDDPVLTRSPKLTSAASKEVDSGDATHPFGAMDVSTWLSLHLSERKLLLFTGDSLCWVLAAAVANLMFGGALPGVLLLGLAFAAVAWLVVSWVFGSYDVETAARTGRILPVIAKSLVVVSALAIAWAFVSSKGTVGRFGWALSFFTAAELLTLWRISYLTVFTLPLFSRRLLFAGADDLNLRLASMIRTGWSTQFAIVGFMGTGQSVSEAGPMLVGDLFDAPAIAKSMRASEIIASPETIATTAGLERLIACIDQGIKVTPASMLYEELFGRVAVGQVDQRYIIDLARGAYPDRTYLGVKRLVDVALALVGGAVMLVLLPFVAAAILVDSGRPVLYRQKRVGASGRIFEVVKFRTMRNDSEAGGKARWASRRDSRVTRVGRLLRKSRLDELPQVLNVLAGEMSIVGPRPERPEFVSDLQKAIPFYGTRHAVKPGLTGWAQVNMGYGASVDDARAKLEYDLFYIRRMSLPFDALIIARTIGTVLRMGGH